MSFVSLEQRRNIFCHRGLWDSLTPQNSLSANKSAAESGFSIETDIRQFMNRVVISHDSPQSEKPPELSDLTSFMCSFALNIKEDGLQSLVREFHPWITETNSFVFDGSLPEMHRYQKAGIPHALRLSEYERTIPWNSGHIWLDSFHDDWWIKDKDLEKFLEGSRIVVVSPELHGRDPRFVWDHLQNESSKGKIDFSICTDRPLDFLNWK